MALASQDALEEGIRARWHGSYGMADDGVCVVRPSSRADRREIRDERTMFSGDEGWQAVDLTLVQRRSTEAEVRSALEDAGFAEVSAYDAERDLGEARVIQRGADLRLGRVALDERQVHALPALVPREHRELVTDLAATGAGVGAHDAYRVVDHPVRAVPACPDAFFQGILAGQRHSHSFPAAFTAKRNKKRLL